MDQNARQKYSSVLVANIQSPKLPAGFWEIDLDKKEVSHENIFLNLMNDGTIWAANFKNALDSFGIHSYHNDFSLATIKSWCSDHSSM
jgi:hypothetical protein